MSPESRRRHPPPIDAVHSLHEFDLAGGDALALRGQDPWTITASEPLEMLWFDLHD